MSTTTPSRNSRASYRTDKALSTTLGIETKTARLGSLFGSLASTMVTASSEAVSGMGQREWLPW